MFIGHFAAGYGAKKAAPRTSLGTLFLAAQFVDLLWPVFLLLGIEHVRIDPGNTPMTPLDFYDYPYSHSLLAAVIWSIVLGAIYFGIRRYRAGALVVGATVFSHWVLDLISHRPDLPLAPGSATVVGLGLWYSPIGTLVVEIGLYIIGAALYATATQAKDRIGQIGFWALAIVLLALYIVNLFAPPPPDAMAIAIAGNLTWLFVIWAYWVDRHREPRIQERLESLAQKK